VPQNMCVSILTHIERIYEPPWDYHFVLYCGNETWTCPWYCVELL